jgi:SAM-dependent methyltransferase
MLPQQAWDAASAIAATIDDAQMDRYHPASNAIGCFSNEDGAFSWCRPIAGRDYDRVVFLPGCRLIDTAWSMDWIISACSGLKEDGLLILPYRGDGKVSEPAGLKPYQLDKMLGKPLRVGDGFATFRPAAGAQHARSTAGLFMGSVYAWIGRFAEYRGAELRPDLSIEDWRGNETAWIIDETTFLDALTSDFLSETFADLARYLVFAAQGINAKSHSMIQVFSALFQDHGVLRWADLGSGSGFLGIELAMQIPVQVFNIDKSLAQSRLGVDMLNKVPAERIVGECTMITSRLETVAFPAELDAVSMLTTLCYVPKEAQHPLLRRAWDALRPGGALLIFENIRSRAYTRDYSLMFEEAELNGMLDELGGVARYFHAVTGCEMDASTARGKTCYRARIKP